MAVAVREHLRLRHRVQNRQKLRYAAQYWLIAHGARLEGGTVGGYGKEVSHLFEPKRYKQRHLRPTCPYAGTCKFTQSRRLWHCTDNSAENHHCTLEVGFLLAEWLATEHKEVVVIDKNEQNLRHMCEHLDVQTLYGSGSNPKVLEEAGIKDADIILAVTDSDEVNLIACFFANLLAPNIHKVALIRNEAYVAYREQLARDIVDIDLVINPEVEVVNSILRIMSAPDVEQINEFVGGRIKMVGKRLPAQSLLNGLKLAQLPGKIPIEPTWSSPR